MAPLNLPNHFGAIPKSTVFLSTCSMTSYVSISDVKPQMQWWMVRGLAKSSIDEAEKAKVAGTKENIV